MTQTIVITCSPPIFAAQFPLPQAPRCHRCGSQTQRSIVKPTNPNGNAGRPYYHCTSCSTPRSRHLDFGTWVTWDDARGIYNRNPQCDCGVVSRQDRAGVDTEMSGFGFWTCAMGRCGYFSKYMNGLTEEEMEGSSLKGKGFMFRPWLF